MAGEQLFRRRVKVALAQALSSDFSTVSALVTEIEDLRVSFKFTKALTKDPNTCEIKIYNLSAETRANLPGTGTKVLLRGGYESTEELLFVGDARVIESKREGADWVTTFRCGDGERAVQFARVSTSFASGTKISDAIRTIGKATKMDTGNLESLASGLSPSLQYTQGLAVHGSAIKELEKALKVAGYELSIQEGALLALKPGESTTEEVIELSEDSGLIGSPEVAGGEKKAGKNKAASKPVLKAKSLLHGQLRCGRRVSLKSRQYNGLYRIVKVDGSGDTFGGDWYSDLELEAAR
jgi:hypothetical protein